MKKLLCTLLALCVVFSVSSCGKPSCDHNYDNYIVKTPTCTEKGLLEKLCKVCGQKTYEDITATGHSFINGKCTVCGEHGSSGTDILPVPMPSNANNSAMWSMQKIRNTSEKFGFSGSYTDFLNYLSNGYIQDVYVTTLGFIHLDCVNKANGANVPLFFPYSKVSPENTEESKLTDVYRLEMDGKELLITYSDGLQVPAGKLSTEESVYVTGFGLNVKNEVVIYYSDNTIAFAGTVAKGNPPENQSGFVYREISTGYNIINVYTEDEIIKIPVSHRGKTIQYIENYTFKNVAETVKSIVIPETVAFDDFSFDFLTSETNIYFEGTPSNLPNCNANLYPKGTWSYKNDVPTPNL